MLNKKGSFFSAFIVLIISFLITSCNPMTEDSVEGKWQLTNRYDDIIFNETGGIYEFDGSKVYYKNSEGGSLGSYDYSMSSNTLILSNYRLLTWLTFNNIKEGTYHVYSYNDEMIWYCSSGFIEREWYRFKAE